MKQYGFPLRWPTPPVENPKSLFEHIEREVDQLLTSEVAERLSSGNVAPAALAQLFANVAFQSFHGPVTFALAGARLATSHPRISDYLIAHAGEETRHWQWAMEDLESVGGDTHTTTVPSPAALQYAGYYYFCAHSCPLARLGSALFLEQMGPQSHRVITGLAKRYPNVPFRFFRSHAVTDAQHSKEIAEVIESADLSAEEIGLLAWAASTARPLYQALYDM